MSRSVTTGALWCVVWCPESGHYDSQPCDFPIEQGWEVYCTGLAGRSQAERVAARLTRLAERDYKLPVDLKY